MTDEPLQLHKFIELIEEIELKAYKPYNRLDTVTKKQLLSHEGRIALLMDKLTEVDENNDYVDSDYNLLVAYIRQLYISYVKSTSDVGYIDEDEDTDEDTDGKTYDYVSSFTNSSELRLKEILYKVYDYGAFTISCEFGGVTAKHIIDSIVEDIKNRKEPFNKTLANDITLKEIDNVLATKLRNHGRYIEYMINPSDEIEFKSDLSIDLDIISGKIDELNEAVKGNFNVLQRLITSNDFVYLGARNNYNCTINSTFHMIMNSAILTGRLDMSEPTFTDEEKTDVWNEIVNYVSNWYDYFKTCINKNSISAVITKDEKDKYNETQSAKIDDILRLTMKDNKLELRWIVYYYVFIHWWIYCECALESVYNEQISDTLINRMFRNETGKEPAVFTLTYSQHDSLTNVYKHYNMNVVETDYKNKLRYSNRIGNYIIRRFCNKLNTDQIDYLTFFNDLNYLPPQIDLDDVIYGTKNKCIAKYYDGGHAKVILYIRSDDNKVEYITIDDQHMPSDGLDLNEFNGNHICAGIYVITRNHDVKHDKIWNGWKQATSLSSHMTSALFFNGGVIVSLLTVVCIIAIIVCVVIYIHDYYWFKPTTIGLSQQL